MPTFDPDRESNALLDAAESAVGSVSDRITATGLDLGRRVKEMREQAQNVITGFMDRGTAPEDDPGRKPLEDVSPAGPSSYIDEEAFTGKKKTKKVNREKTMTHDPWTRLQDSKSPNSILNADERAMQGIFAANNPAIETYMRGVGNEGIEAGKFTDWVKEESRDISGKKISAVTRGANRAQYLQQPSAYFPWGITSPTGLEAPKSSQEE